MKLSIYRMREEVKEFEETIRQTYLEGDERFEQLPPKDALPFDGAAYIQAKRAKRPRWLDFHESHFDLAQLFTMSSEYRKKVEEAGSSKWSDFEVSTVPTIVYAIATDREGDLADTLFFFSLVNLAEHSEQIRSRGHGVELARIRYE